MLLDESSVTLNRLSEEPAWYPTHCSPLFGACRTQCTLSLLRENPVISQESLTDCPGFFICGPDSVRVMSQWTSAGGDKAQFHSSSVAIAVSASLNQVLWDRRKEGIESGFLHLKANSKAEMNTKASILFHSQQRKNRKWPVLISTE